MTEAGKTRNPFVWLWRYLKESREELLKTTWPTRAQTIKYSTAVIVGCVVLALLFAALDFGLTVGLQRLIELKNT